MLESSKVDRLVTLTSDRTRRRILALILGDEDLNASEIATRIDNTQPNVSRLLNQFELNDVIRKVGSGRAKGYAFKNGESAQLVKKLMGVVGAFVDDNASEDEDSGAEESSDKDYEDEIPTPAPVKTERKGGRKSEAAHA